MLQIIAKSYEAHKSFFLWGYRRLLGAVILVVVNSAPSILDVLKPRCDKTTHHITEMHPFLCNEILDLVFSNFEDTIDVEDGSDHGLYPSPKDTDIPTLKSLCLVSHHFYRLARRNLYRTISSGKLNDQEDNTKMCLLARTLLLNPELRLEIRAIDLSSEEDWKTPLVNGDFWPPSIERVEPPQLRGLLREDIARYSATEAGTSFLLALMPKLRMVVLADPQTQSKALTWILGGKISTPQAGTADRPEPVANYLGQLEEIHWSPLRTRSEDSGACSTEHLLLLPNIKRLFLSAYAPNFTISHPVVPDFQSGLQSLTLDAGMIRPAFLHYTLSRCKALQHLNLDLTDCYDLKEEAMTVDLYEFGSILREFGQALVSLRLRFYDCEEYAQGKIGSLQGLKRLRRLSAPIFVLAGTFRDEVLLQEVLPESVETLEMDFVDVCRVANWDYMVWNSAANDDRMVRFLCNNQLPKLQEVVYGYFSDGKDDRVTHFTKVEGWSVKNEAQLRCSFSDEPYARRLELVRGE
ncbi:hypothetical protein H9Q72_010236 [Fusarium xylarioides]|uniref:Uncharacterized protein n=1 Tax=Fusarium xylarioides TaxID=221167 RepID=A0A9P7HQ97_9HYPO|nr:hypothetical protein H9Q70_007833 [Fusarium xylarioides]KAG5761652.1 hypothetical protein H9Q72_010236 [Fusarium xylarioides]KAG5774286.1 hypothetical protein H9Q73_011762 [Fusarium xylarioides]